MKVRHDNGPKRARLFVRKNSGSLIIYENRFWPYFGFFLEIGVPATLDTVIRGNFGPGGNFGRFTKFPKKCSYWPENDGRWYFLGLKDEKQSIS